MYQHKEIILESEISISYMNITEKEFNEILPTKHRACKNNNLSCPTEL